MTKTEMKEMMKNAIEPRRLCRVYMKYDAHYWYYFPLLVSDKLFLGAEEDDFILDGYSIRMFRDVKKVEIKDDKCSEILRAEGVPDGLVVPEVDVSDWYHVFLSLQCLGKNVIVEEETVDGVDSQFAIGKIVKVLKQKVLLREFDADGIWQEGLLEIPYTRMTSVTFGSRYVEVFSKYLEEAPSEE